MTEAYNVPTAEQMVEQELIEKNRRCDMKDH